eukprot:4955358-Alexandrium_andersonii.AAC.1
MCIRDSSEHVLLRVRCICCVRLRHAVPPPGLVQMPIGLLPRSHEKRGVTGAVGLKLDPKGGGR